MDTPYSQQLKDLVKDPWVWAAVAVFVLILSFMWMSPQLRPILVFLAIVAVIGFTPVAVIALKEKKR